MLTQVTQCKDKHRLHYLPTWSYNYKLKEKGVCSVQQQHRLAGLVLQRVDSQDGGGFGVKAKSNIWQMSDLKPNNAWRDTVKVSDSIFKLLVWDWDKKTKRKGTKPSNHQKWKETLYNRHFSSLCTALIIIFYWKAYSKEMKYLVHSSHMKSFLWTIMNVEHIDWKKAKKTRR